MTIKWLNDLKLKTLAETLGFFDGFRVEKHPINISGGEATQKNVPGVETAPRYIRLRRTLGARAR